MDNGLKISDLTIGYSTTGAQAYLTDLNAKAITETKTKLGDIKNIRDALEKGWIGQAQINYVTNLQNSITKIQETLDELQTTLETQFADIEETWREQDAKIVAIEE